ncbi:hypothetical protein [Sphingobacterium suaedae]|uniref:HTH araC/xylS-type domain-containing protein n=1 Tax=Sphingobacterium suaedae TaxID=1686402 RepID=A0ABW5KJ83_9SPHI
MQDVYLAVGFRKPTYFSTAFKKQYHMTPTEK